VLSRLFRGKFIGYLREAFERDKLTLHGELRLLSETEYFADWLRALTQQEWVVFAKRPFGGPEQVLKYLARYTHRVAISNQRLLSFKDGKVTFGWKDYANGNARKQMTLSAGEFTRRFLLHVLPRGFVRIRHYGFLANRRRRVEVALCKTLLGERVNREAPSGRLDESQSDQIKEAHFCPVCQSGHMKIVEKVEPGCTMLDGAMISVPRFDSS
jgi:hypothetical protein